MQNILKNFISNYKIFNKTNVEYDNDISNDKQNTILFAYTNYELNSDRILNSIKLDLIDYLKANNIDYLNVDCSRTAGNKIVIILILNGINEMMKITKPELDTFINVENGIGDCSICNKKKVDINTHVCTEVITDLNKFKIFFEKSKLQK